MVPARVRLFSRSAAVAVRRDPEREGGDLEAAARCGARHQAAALGRQVATCRCETRRVGDPQMTILSPTCGLPRP